MAPPVPVCVLVLVLLLALALSGEAAKRLKKSDQNPACPEIPDVLRFHFGGNFPPFDSFVNEPDPQTRTGFSVKLTELLCKRNNLNCQFIKHAYNECWTTTGEGNPGRGILDGSFDACATYTHTFTRQSSMDFTHAYTERAPAGILARLDENGDPVVPPRDNNLGGLKIGVVGGWPADEASLQYIKNGCTGERFSNFKVVTPKDKFGGPDAAFRALLNGKIDLLYAFTRTIDDRKNCDQAQCDPELYTGLGEKYAWIHTGIFDYQANGMTLAFAMKGDPIIPFLNPLVDDFLKTKEYADLCEEYAGEDITCFRNEFFEGREIVGRGSLNDVTRTENCKNRPTPADQEACNACSSGFCGCDV